MRCFNLMLSPAEVEAYAATDLEPTGTSADDTRMLMRAAAVTARIMTEIEELNARGLPYLPGRCMQILW